jgi:predicted DNA-binding transcriptional regulator AlpA
MITDAIISLARVCSIVGRHRSTVYRWTRAGRFPQPLGCGGYSVREVGEWLELQKDLRPVTAPLPVRPMGKRALAKAQETWRLAPRRVKRLRFAY